MNKHKIPCPERQRNPRACTFGWLDHRFLTEGWLSQLSAEALRLYVFLMLVANQAGVSWYSYDRICAKLHMDVDSYVSARNELLRRSLIAYKDGVFQVLALPAPAPPSTTSVSPNTTEFCRAEDFKSLKALLSQLAQNDHHLEA